MFPSYFPKEIPLLLYNNEKGDARRGHIIRNRVIMNFNHEGEIVRLDLVKAHDNPATGELRLRLDPKTLLIAKAGRTK
jgi:hypothetical protein